jgi:hypothetical protein
MLVSGKELLSIGGAIGSLAGYRHSGDQENGPGYKSDFVFRTFNNTFNVGLGISLPLMLIIDGSASKVAK